MSGTATQPETPKVEFIQDVAHYLQNRTAEEAIQALNENYRQLKMEESSLLQKRAYNLGKLPELKKTLGIVKMLAQRIAEDEKAVVNFELSDSVFAKASFKNVTSVNLWLGAHVMVEYSLEEARSVLEASLLNCETNLENMKNKLEQVKDSVTITEVSIARIYNHDIEQRRQQK